MDLRPFRAIKKIEQELEELHRADQAAEEAARFEIVQSAGRFSRRTKEVVDSTMSLSATLMRAGEVAEANRLLADAEQEVRNEEAALIETVNEVKVSAAHRRHRISRLRLFKAVATVALGGTLTMGSAFGVVLTNHLVNRPDRVAGAATPDSKVAAARRGLKSVPVAGVKLKLTQRQFKEYKQLLAGRVDKAGLKEFLEEVLADDPGLVAEIHAALVGTVGVDVADVVEPLASELTRAKPSTGEEPDATADQPEPSPNDQPTESPSDAADKPDEPDDSPEPSPEPNPTPPEDDGDKDGADGLPLVPDGDGG
jgi:hypothetical protein